MPLPKYQQESEEAPSSTPCMNGTPHCYIDNLKRHLQFLENEFFAARSFKIVVHAISMPITCVSRD
jgi:hypothetical protein